MSADEVGDFCSAHLTRALGSPRRPCVLLALGAAVLRPSTHSSFHEQNTTGLRGGGLASPSELMAAGDELLQARFCLPWSRCTVVDPGRSACPATSRERRAILILHTSLSRSRRLRRSSRGASTFALCGGGQNACGRAPRQRSPSATPSTTCWCVRESQPCQCLGAPFLVLARAVPMHRAPIRPPLLCCSSTSRSSRTLGRSTWGAQLASASRPRPCSRCAPCP